MNEENEQIQQRKAKLEELKNQSYNVYSSEDFKQFKKANSKLIKENFNDEAEPIEYCIAGRIIALRGMGKVIFATLQDENDTLQLFVKKDNIEDYAIFKTCDLGDIIVAKGELFRTKVGEITLRVRSFKLVSKSLRPLPEKFHGLKNVEQKYRQRYLDLISNRESFEIFKKRSLISREIRNFLDNQEFLEVETPMMHAIVGGASAKPFLTHYNALKQDIYFRIAPEIYLKKLLVGGFEKIYEMNRNFRNEGLSRQHNPEFTSLEIYQAFANYEDMMKLIKNLIQTVAQKVCGSLKFKNEQGEEIDLSNFSVKTFYQLLDKYTQTDWRNLNLEEKIKFAKNNNIHIPENPQDYEISQEIYEKFIEPTLIQATFVTQLPYQFVPLAKRNNEDKELVDVYELVIDGKEISPGYTELNDPIEQNQRLQEQYQASLNTNEEESGKIDQDFLTALEFGMPPAGGLGLGIDRLVMILTESYSIRDVILFPQLKK